MLKFVFLSLKKSLSSWFFWLRGMGAMDRSHVHRYYIIFSYASSRFRFEPISARCGITSRLYKIHCWSACPGVPASITSVPARFKNKKNQCGRPLAELDVVCTFILQSNYLDYLGQNRLLLTVRQLYSRLRIHACTASITNCTWVN